VEHMANMGAIICGDPDEAIEQCRRWESTGADQLVISIGAATIEDSLETIQLIGRHVLPKLDHDPVHRTSRMRDGAAVG
jgi:hypothetical protein